MILGMENVSFSYHLGCDSGCERPVAGAAIAPVRETGLRGADGGRARGARSELHSHAAPAGPRGPQIPAEPAGIHAQDGKAAATAASRSVLALPRFARSRFSRRVSGVEGGDGAIGDGPSR